MNENTEIKTLRVGSRGAKRGRVMEEVQDRKTSEVIAVRWEKKTRTFYFEESDVYYICEVIDPLLKKARELLETRRIVEFFEVIQVEAEEVRWFQSDGFHRVQIEFSRFLVGFHNSSGNLFELDWSKRDRVDMWVPHDMQDASEDELDDHFNGQRLSSMTLHATKQDRPSFPMPNPEDSDQTWLAYSDEVWERLERLGATIDAIDAELRDLFAPERVQELAGSGVPLLDVVMQTQDSNHE